MKEVRFSVQINFEKRKYKEIPKVKQNAINCPKIS